MDADELYLAIIDEIDKELNKYYFKSREELRERINILKDEYIEKVENVFAEIEDDYADAKGLEWEE